MQRIAPIWRHEEMIPVIAKWHWDEWGHVDEIGSLESWTEGLQRRTAINTIPTTYVALSEQDEPIGSVVLVEHDMNTHPELSPWLAGLYVLPSCRGRGLGATLTQHAMDRCMEMGFERLYLHTSTAMPLYQRLGWKLIFRELYEKEWTNVMRYCFKKSNTATSVSD